MSSVVCRFVERCCAKERERKECRARPFLGFTTALCFAAGFSPRRSIIARQKNTPCKRHGFAFHRPHRAQNVKVSGKTFNRGGVARRFETVCRRGFCSRTFRCGFFSLQVLRGADPEETDPAFVSRICANQRSSRGGDSCVSDVSYGAGPGGQPEQPEATIVLNLCRSKGLSQPPLHTTKTQGRPTSLPLGSIRRAAATRDGKASWRRREARTLPREFCAHRILGLLAGFRVRQLESAAAPDCSRLETRASQRSKRSQARRGFEKLWGIEKKAHPRLSH